MRRLLIGMLLCLLSLVCAKDARAVVVAFEFTGFVNIVNTADPDIFSIPAGTIVAGPDAATGSPVSGRFTYDTESTPTHDVEGTCVDCGYRQQYSQGFRMTIGGVEVSADDYVVEFIDNPDIPVPFPPFLITAPDVLNVTFLSNHYVPPLTSPLMVAGQPEAVGTFNLSFVAFFNPFTTSLPGDLDAISLDNLKFAVGFLNDHEVDDVGSFDAHFLIDAPLTAAPVDSPPTEPGSLSTPEPSSACLTAIAGTLMGWFRFDFFHRKRRSQ